MNKIGLNFSAFIFIALPACFKLCAQDIDTLTVNKTSQSIEAEKIVLSIYTRTIGDAKGNVRVDQNIVPRIRLNDWLRLELGIRKGETTRKFDAYYHYKVEVQTKYFWNVLRFVARLSDNIVKYTNPVYRKSNYLLIAEGRYPLSKRWVALAAGGYVFTRQQNNSLDGWPVMTNGTPLHYPTYKIGLRFLVSNKSSVNAAWGVYDVFNPYALSNPFFQLGAEYELNKRFTLFCNVRHQYDRRVDVPFNKFLGLGVQYHIKKK